MRQIILDASAILAFFAPDATPQQQDYANHIVENMVNHHLTARVPPLWDYEIANSLIVLRRKKLINEKQAVHIRADLRQLPIRIAHHEGNLIEAITPIAQTYHLSAYDAAYLELAMRLDTPVATLDKNLQAAAQKADFFFSGK